MNEIPIPMLKTVYAVFTFDFEADRKWEIEQMLKIVQLDQKTKGD